MRWHLGLLLAFSSALDLSAAGPLDSLEAKTIPAGRQFSGQPKQLVAIFGEPREPLDDTHRRFQVAFRPDGKMLAFSSSGSPVCLIDMSGAEPKERTLPPGKPSGFAHAVVFAPDGKTLALAGRDVRLWDLSGAEPKERPIAKGYFGIVHSLAFAPDGKTLAAGCLDGAVRLYDLTAAEPKEKAALRFDSQKVRGYGVAFAPDGKTLASVYFRDKGVRLWDLSDSEPKERAVLKGHRGGDSVQAVAFTPDGKKLFTGGMYEPFPLVWDPAGAKPAGVAVEKHGGRHVCQLAMAPDGQSIAGSDYEGRIVLWDTSAGKKLQEWQLPGAQGIAFAPDGRHLAAAAKNSTVYVLRLALAEK